MQTITFGDSRLTLDLMSFLSSDEQCEPWVEGIFLKKKKSERLFEETCVFVIKYC